MGFKLSVGSLPFFLEFVKVISECFHVTFRYSVQEGIEALALFEFDLFVSFFSEFNKLFCIGLDFPLYPISFPWIFL